MGKFKQNPETQINQEIEGIYKEKMTMTEIL